MAWFKKKDIEERADLITPNADGVLLSALIGNTSISKKEALNIPTVKGCINFATNTVSMIPIKLYKEINGEIEEVKNDIRVSLLNDDTGDTLNSVEFWRAVLVDYFMGKGGYAYINKDGNNFKSIHYVDETQLSIIKNNDPIFKDYGILVNAKEYKPYDFIKVLRNSKDGSAGESIIDENDLVLSVMYNSLLYERHLVEKGGNKKGFLKSTKKLTQEVIDKLKEAWKNLYSNNTETVVVLNEGMEFQEASNSSVEMQMNENKKTNSEEICKLFNFTPGVINGTATEKEYLNTFKVGIMPILAEIICALNKDFLLEREKAGDEVYYYAFDTKEMLKGDIKSRYEAYSMAIKDGYLKIDEVRYKEDLEPFGIDWINVGLNSVLYNTKTKVIYTPNTNQTQSVTDEPPKGGE